MSLLLLFNRRRSQPSGGGPALPPSIALLGPSRVFAYRPQGGIWVGGAAETSLERVPARVYAFQGGARGRLGGEARTAHFDMGAHIRRLDDDFVLLAV